nr:phosphotransferase [uncultured Jannaschia sp.]
MAWVDAPRVDTLVRDASEGQRTASLRQAGEWLARLHAAGPCRRMDRDFRNLCGRLRTRFAFSVRGVEAEALLKALDRRAREIGRVARTGVPLHWDFKPRNLFATPSGIVGFDLGLTKPGLALHDAASFLTAIELDRYETEVFSARQSGTIEGDRRAFFAGYGALEACDVPLLDMIEDQLLVARWLRHRAIAMPPAERVAATARVLAIRGLSGNAVMTRPGRPVRRRFLPARWSDGACP